MHDPQPFPKKGTSSLPCEAMAHSPKYLLGLQKEPLEETLQMEYWQKLLNLQASEYITRYYTIVSMPDFAFPETPSGLRSIYGQVRRQH
jgi:hypothetical protein